MKEHQSPFRARLNICVWYVCVKGKVPESKRERERVCQTLVAWSRRHENTLECEPYRYEGENDRVFLTHTHTHTHSLSLSLSLSLSVPNTNNTSDNTILGDQGSKKRKQSKSRTGERECDQGRVAGPLTPERYKGAWLEAYHHRYCGGRKMEKEKGKGFPYHSRGRRPRRQSRITPFNTHARRNGARGGFATM